MLVIIESLRGLFKEFLPSGENPRSDPKSSVIEFSKFSPKRPEMQLLFCMCLIFSLFRVLTTFGLDIVALMGFAAKFFSFSRRASGV